MKRKIAVIVAIFLSPIIIIGQNLPSLDVSKEIVKGTLPNGAAYYLVSNTSEKGFADYAVVQKEDLDNDLEKKALTYLSHFGLRKPYRLMSESGVGFHSGGFVTKLPGATFFHFKNVPTYKSSVADSTLLMLMDLASVSRKPQAIIISGDIDIAKIKERMALLSIMNGKLESSPQTVNYKWTATNEISVTTSPNASRGIATIEAIYRSRRQSKQDMNTALPLVINSYSNLLEHIVRQRLTKAFAQNDVPLIDFDFSYSDSAQGPFDEYFSFKVYTSAECIETATELLSSQLAAIDKNGAYIDEIELAASFNSPTSTTNQLKTTNAEYIEKCVAAYLYGANLAPLSTTSKILNIRNLGTKEQQRLFNNYASALLDANKNLQLRFTSPLTLPENVLKEKFLSAWNKDLELSGFHTVPREAKPKNKTKLKSESPDPISSGTLWTFANGIKVVYKQLPTKGEFLYSLILNSGLSSVNNLTRGEAPFVEKMVNISKIAGASAEDFKNYYASEGIIINQKISVSNTEICGVAPSEKLDKVLAALLSITNDSYLDDELFESFKRSEILSEDMSAFRPRNVNERMRIALLPDYPFSPYSSAEMLSSELFTRVNSFMNNTYSRINDGILIIVGNIDTEEAKKQLSKYLGDFRTDQKLSSRIAVRANFFNGINSIEEHSVPGVVGGSEISANLALSVPLACSAGNIATVEVALKFIEKEMAASLVDLGAYFELSSEVDLFPSERMTIYVNAKPCNDNGLPLGIVPLSPQEMKEALVEFFTSLDSIEIRNEDLKAYIALVRNNFEQTQNLPSQIKENVKLRYSNGKDLVSNRISAINNVNEAALRNIFSLLSTSTRIEYTID